LQWPEFAVDIGIKASRTDQILLPVLPGRVIGASELSKSCEKRLILPNVAYFVVFAKSPPFFFLGGPF
jgi:hypothetical protein